MIKAIHTADWHCRDDDLDEVKKCLTTLIKTVKKEEPDILVISGDIFDSRHVKLDSLSAKLIFDSIQEIANLVPVAIVTGTPFHDGTTVEALRYIKARYPIWVSTKPEQIYLSEGDLNSDISKLYAPAQAPIDAVISLIPPPTKQNYQSMSDIDSTNKEISDAMTAMFAGFGAKAQEFTTCPHLLGGHLSIGGAFVSDTQQLVGVDIEVSTDQLSLANATVNMLGHIHYAQQIGKNTFYAGDLYRMDTGEMEDKGFWIHEMSAAGLQKSTFIKTPTRKLYKLKYDFTDSHKDFKIPFTTEMLDRINDAIVTIVLRAFEDEVSKIDMDDLESNLAKAKSYDAPKIIRVPRENVRSEKLLKLKTLREKIIEQARLRGEKVSESTLSKADDLEFKASDEVVAGIGY